MKSKEVTKAINRTQQLKQFIKERGKEFSFYDNENSVIAYESLETVLAYVEKLENENTELRKRIDEIAIAGLRMSNY